MAKDPDQGGTSYFEALGGEPALRSIIDDFIDRCFADTMIGFLFRRADPARIKAFEYEHAAQWLGAGVEYGGRPLGATHRPHRILGGQFARRKKILADVLHEHGVPPRIREEWLDHQESLRAMITRDFGGNCTD